jgi:CCR4-NOT complex subunit CAF16
MRLFTVHRLVEVLGLNMKWRLHQLSEGQRRRVQIFIGLLYPFEVLLLDEITTDLDVVGRQDLIEFLRQDCEERGATMIYATHIFDGLEDWATHLAYIAGGRLQRFSPISEVEELQHVKGVVVAPLFRTVETWLRKELKERKEREKALGSVGIEPGSVDIFYRRHYQGVGGGMAGNFAA